MINSLKCLFTLVIAVAAAACGRAEPEIDLAAAADDLRGGR